MAPIRLAELLGRLSLPFDIANDSAPGMAVRSTVLTVELGRSPTVAELAEAVGAEEEDVIDALDSAHAYSTRSLDAPFEEGGDDSLSEKLGTPEAGYAEVDDGCAGLAASE